MLDFLVFLFVCSLLMISWNLVVKSVLKKVLMIVVVMVMVRGFVFFGFYSVIGFFFVYVNWLLCW